MDLISRQAAIDAIKAFLRNDDDWFQEAAASEIRKLPSVKLHGRLIDKDELIKTLGIAEECNSNCPRYGTVGCKEDSAFVWACECITDAPIIIDNHDENNYTGMGVNK